MALLEVNGGSLQFAVMMEPSKHIIANMPANLLGVLAVTRMSCSVLSHLNEESLGKLGFAAFSRQELHM